MYIFSIHEVRLSNHELEFNFRPPPTTVDPVYTSNFEFNGRRAYEYRTAQDSNKRARKGSIYITYTDS